MKEKTPKNSKETPKAESKPQVKKPALKSKVVKIAPVALVIKNAKDLLGLHNIKAPYGAHKKRKLLGRGPGSGHGKTSTRGSKGQTSRAGRHFYLGFEGGQSPLIRKMPKRGFVSNFKKAYQVVNLELLNKIKESTITPEVLKKNGLIRDEAKLVKILGNGSIKNPVTILAHAFSKRAAAEITNAGGKVQILNV
ncbi:50S ribosomal protein L15 [Patescibacteria group bacterium]|nr:50S ribosomal protein L15 [Patescibacteria group bacterium]